MNVKNLAFCLAYSKPLLNVSYIIIKYRTLENKFIWSRFAKGKQTMGGRAMSWKRLQGINAVISSHPKEGTPSQNSSLSRME